MFARALAASILAASVLTISPATGPASAQTYPSRPVTMLVAFPPGGVDDTIARMIHPALEKVLNQTVVVEKSDEQTPAAASKLLDAEIKRWGDVIRANHITGG